MKKIIYGILIVASFLYAFYTNGGKLGFDRGKEIVSVKENIENTTKFEEKSDETELQNNQVEFKYKPFYKTEKLTLYLNNPYRFDFPSDYTRVHACRFLIDEMNNAKKSIDFAIYGIDAQNEFIRTFEAIKNSGIKIRGVSDSNEKGRISYYDMKQLKGKVDITYDNQSNLMHNKFFIVDDKFVLTGSMNITKTGCGGYNSNIVFGIRDDEIIKAYKNEFEQMYNGSFKIDKKDYSVDVKQIDSETKLGVYFSPKGNVYRKVLKNEILNAKNKIRINIFVLTHKELIKDLIDAKKRGVEVIVLMDALGASRYKEVVSQLRENNIKVKIENWGGKNHEKTISIDNNVLIAGSANFSYSGFMKNDENVLVVKNRKLSEFYNNYFDKLYTSIDDKYLDGFVQAEGIESVNSCFDGMDNDFDGLVDIEDSGCKK